MSKQVGAGKLKASILSLSLLTVMAGAAVSPALSAIQEYFADVNVLLIRLIVCLPALFICITSFIFPHLTKKFRLKTLVIAALIIYMGCGCLAVLSNNIWVILILRAGLGVGVGMIMPLSTGLISFYCTPQEQPGMMGLSSAMNNVGGIIGTLIAGVLANVDWHLSFLVYLMGLIAFVLCLFFLPNEMLGSNDSKKSGESNGMGKVFKANYVFVVGIFLHMSTFYLYPTNFSMESVAAGNIPVQLISVIMALMNFMGFVGGLLYVRLKAVCKSKIRFISPTLFVAGYILLVIGGVVPTIIGSVLIGYASGQGIPLIMTEASRRVGKTAAATIMPLLSAAMYLGQFLCPFIMSGVTAIVGKKLGLPYYWGIILAIVYLLWCIRMKIGESK